MRTISRILSLAAFAAYTAAPWTANAQEPAAYALAEITVLDAAKLAEFASASTPPMAAAGGEFLSRRSKVTSVVGTPATQITLIKFPSVAKAESYYNSAEYKKLIPLRDAAGKFQISIIQAGDNAAK